MRKSYKKSYVDIIDGRLKAQPVPSFADHLMEALSFEMFKANRERKAALLLQILEEVGPPGLDEDPEKVAMDLKQLVRDLFWPDFFDHVAPAFELSLQQIGKSWDTMVAPHRNVRDQIVNDLNSRIDTLVYRHAKSRAGSRVPSHKRKERLDKKLEQYDALVAAYLEMERKYPDDSGRKLAERVKGTEAGREFAEDTIRKVVRDHMKKSGRKRSRPNRPT